MAGKNKIERGFRIYFDNSGGTPVDLTGDLLPGTIEGGGFTLDEIDMTGVSQKVKQFLGGHSNSAVSAQFYMNDSANGAHTILANRVGSVGTLTLQYGSSGNAPVTGDPQWSGEYVLLSATVGQSGGKMILTCSFQPAAGQPDPAWGTVP